ncbi:MAG: hypothetical protein R3C12_06555 [Planctomycetaceae bacterium]
MIANMAAGCPVNNLIPEWNDLVYRDQWRERSIGSTRINNFLSSPVVFVRLL